MAQNEKGKKAEEQRVVQLSDVGTPELHKQFPVVIEGEGLRRRATVLDHPLVYYKKRAEVNEVQFYAGIYLMQDYAVSHQNKSAFSFLRAELGISVTTVTDHENPHTAMERYRRAMALLPLVAQKLAWHVCIEGNLVSEVRVAQFPNWNKKNNGMDRFREMLDQLADYYTADRKAATTRRESLIDKDKQALEAKYGIDSQGKPEA